MNYKLNFNTAYHQIYLKDKESLQDSDDEEFWTTEAYHSRLAITNNILGVGLECYGNFKGELILLNNKNQIIDYDQYDHIVEGGINVKSGILQVLDCPNSSIELEIKVTPGIYRVRIYSSNLVSVVDDSGDDYYQIEIWPDSIMERSVLKQYLSI